MNLFLKKVEYPFTTSVSIDKGLTEIKLP